MDPAPGYDPLMPHDLFHLVVESQLGLIKGIFGQLAAGGDAGTFHPIPDPTKTVRENARLRKRIRERGKTLLRDGQSDSARSEKAVYFCWQQWHAHNRIQRNSTSHPTLERVGPGEKQLAATEINLDKIFRHLDELSTQWSHLEVGQAIAVTWPDLTVTKHS